MITSNFSIMDRLKIFRICMIITIVYTVLYCMHSLPVDELSRQTSKHINMFYQMLVDSFRQQEHISVKEHDTLLTFRDTDHEFVPYKAKGVYTYHNVCLEDSGVSTINKSIVVYNAKVNEDIELIVAGSASCADHNSWPLTLRKGPPPGNFTMLPYPAYFVTVSIPGNLYHILRDTLVGLYGILKETNRLNSTVKNQLYTRKVYNPLNSPRNNKVSTYEVLVEALGGRPLLGYQEGPTNTCHPHGVFGWKPVALRELADYFEKYFNYNESQCTNSNVTVTFLDRAYRKVTNQDSLLKAARSLGVKVQLVRLDLIPLKEQYEIIRCTDILVGVQGAGLQWVIFMRRNRALIEMVYPGWKVLYAKNYNGYKGIITKTVSGETDGAQWDWLEKEYKRSKPYNQKEKEKFKAPKFMNCKQNANDVKKAVKEILSNPKFMKEGV